MVIRVSKATENGSFAILLVLINRLIDERSLQLDLLLDSRWEKIKCWSEREEKTEAENDIGADEVN